MRIACSVSSGYTSVMMAIKIKEWYPDAEIVNIMANTSRERPESLRFMDECDKFFSLNLVWVEADICLEPNVGTSYVVKTFDSLTTDGSIFEKGIIKYGLPSVANKWCNRELKLKPIHKYLSDIGWGAFGDYYTAVGIRADEIDRISEKKDEFKLLYPMAERGLTKRDRNKFWDDQPIKLSISDFEGNCSHCFEKSMRKQATIHRRRPDLIEWDLEMQRKYSTVKIDGKPTYNDTIDREGGYYSLRGNTPYEAVIELSRTKFREATDEYIYENDLFDVGGQCNRGCAIY